MTQDQLIAASTTGLKLGDDGIWRAASDVAISYPAEGLDGLADVEASSYWYAHRNACLLAAMKRFPPAGALFDIGGGNGYVADVMYRAGYETLLLEPGESGARRGRARGLSVICATLEQAGLAPNSMPAAGMFDVLEHIEDSPGALRSIHGALAQKGRLYITVPAYQALWSQEDEAAGHFRRYTRRTLGAELESADFRPLFMSYFFAMLVPPLFLLRALPARFGIRARNSIENVQADHTLPGGVIGDVFRWSFERELTKIRSAGAVGLGGSLLAIAERA